MKRDINDYLFSNAQMQSAASISLSGKLEAFVGNYFVSGEGIPDVKIYVVYYDEKMDSQFESVQLSSENRVAYVTSDYKFAFVVEHLLDKFSQDTKEYGITYIPVCSFEEQELMINLEKGIPELLKDVIWIEDDFLYDENIVFDYDAFELIDSGIKYLNPKHFSVNALIDILTKIIE